MRTTPLILAAALVAGAGCKKEDKTPPTEPDPSAKTVTAPPEDDDTEPGEGVRGQNEMKNCPSAVEGAKTVVDKTDEAVVVTVTAEGDEAAGQIRARARHLAGIDDPGEGEIRHTGEGTGGANMGKCPIALRDAKASVEEIEGGVKVTVTPKDVGELAELAELATERAEAFRASGSGGGAGLGGGTQGPGGPEGHGSGTGGGQGFVKGGKGDGSGAGDGSGGGQDAKDKAQAKDKAKKPPPADDDDGGW
jgi:hypothetical protein